MQEDTAMCTWEEIGEKWNRAQQMGWQAIQAAMDVGEELTRKKIETPHGEFTEKVARALLLPGPSAKAQASKLMRLALHRELIEEHRPDSMRKALALLPKVPTTRCQFGNSQYLIGFVQDERQPPHRHWSLSRDTPFSP